MGWGGARIGAGRPRKDKGLARLQGSKRHKSKAGERGVAVPPPGDIQPPADMPADQQAIWDQLAPHALAAGTLTPATAESFRDLCRVVVVRNGLFAKIQEDGWTYITVKPDPDGGTHEEIRKHPLVTDLRAFEQRVEAGRARFRLAPMGKEMVSAEQPQDEFAEFDGPKLVKGGA
jgi:hypothetical protein